ncbi:MAG: hypothetical protein C0491_11510 [Novosphingobium sp.]|nr:hypothetical protein [Novosphingobium sp.]
MRTRLSICRRKQRFCTKQDADAAAAASGLVLHSYKCERCFGWHLTSRTKGRRVPRPQTGVQPRPNLSA